MNNKTLLIVGGLVLVGGGVAFYLYQKSKKPGATLKVNVPGNTGVTGKGNTDYAGYVTAGKGLFDSIVSAYDSHAGDNTTDNSTSADDGTDY